MDQKLIVRKLKITLSTIFIFLTTLILSYWLLFFYTQRQMIKGEPYNLGIGGGGGECEIAIYDKYGNADPVKYNMVVGTLTGQAPFYYVNPDSLTLSKDDSGCFIFPGKIDKKYAITGLPYYPIEIVPVINTKAKWLTMGESYSLSVFFDIGNSFNENTVWITTKTPNDKIPVKFSLHAANFTFSPANEETQVVTASLHSPAEQSWSIAPINGIKGKQTIIVSITGDGISINPAIDLQIRNTLGINPLLLSVISALSAVFTYLLTQIRTIRDLLHPHNKTNPTDSRFE